MFDQYNGIPGMEELRPGGGLLRDLEDCKPPHDSVVKSGLQLVLPGGFMLELELYKREDEDEMKEKEAMEIHINPLS